MMEANNKLNEAGMGTRCIHASHVKDQYGSVMPPIYQTSTFAFESCEQGGRRFAGEESGYIYSRVDNPTTSACAERIANIEHAGAATITSSGMAAISTTMLTLLKYGDHVIADKCLYGCTYHLFKHGLMKFGITVTFIDTSEPGAVQAALTNNTRIVYFETPANPTLKIIDIRRVCEEAHSQNDVLVVIDNTFASPIITRPIELGCDIVVHSATKYLNGHSDVVAGVICSSKKIINKIKIEGIMEMTGCILSPHDAFLVMRGLQTLEMRVRTASKNAQRIADFLTNHPAIAKVYYPGLSEHPGHDIAKKQMKYYGSVIAFELISGLTGGKKMLNNLNLCVLAVSLGGCETLIQHPASMTHSCVPHEDRLTAGITDGLVRMSVGVENVEDIIADLEQALDRLV
jgi:methionine-gamma-lyase